MIRLHDTLSRSAKPLVTAGDRYRLYCCGPTVYGPAHIGNFRTFCIQDVLRRCLELDGLSPLHVRNLTDVDDKTIRGSMAAGETLTDFTRRWTKLFHADCAALHCLPPHVEPAATEHIPEQVHLIQKLIQGGHAYAAADGSVYFKVSSFASYGRLSHLENRELETQATNSAGTANDADEYDRESVRDFALWKSHKPEDGPNFWPSPWGDGRPGWHIECSAMSMRYLGETFDLHGGGVDLCFPHHENEIAQSEAATGKPFCHHWFHSAHLMVEGAKMSKSLGNLYTLDNLRDKGFEPAVVRYALISGHYRSQLNFTMNGLTAAASALAKIRKAARTLREKAGLRGSSEISHPKSEIGLSSPGPFASAWDALADDLNVPAALGQIFTTLAELEKQTLDAATAQAAARGLDTLAFALGLDLTEPAAAKVEAPDDVKALAEARWKAKQTKQFAESDRLRNELAAKGWKALDRKDGYDLAPL